MRYVILYSNGAFFADFLAKGTTKAPGTAAFSDKFGFIMRVAQNPYLAGVRYYFNQVFGTDRNAFSTGTAFFFYNNGDAVDHLNCAKRTGVLAAFKPYAAVSACFIPACGKLGRRHAAFGTIVCVISFYVVV